MTILDKTLSQMENVFSSNEFAKQSIKNGYTKRQIDAGYMLIYLRANANQYGSKRMWIKNHAPQIKFDPIQDAIELLKNNGYKVMKPVSEWIEL